MYILQVLYISIFSTVLHFSYDITNHLLIFAIIGSINESTWEHLKIGIFPWITWFVLRSYFFSYINSYFGNLIAIFTFMIICSYIFYGSLFIFKRHVLIISISSFYIGVASGSFSEYIIKDYKFTQFYEIIGFIGCLTLILFGIIWTFYPIKCFLTLDVRYQLYGIEAHENRCDITAKKQYIVYIFNLFGIPFPKNTSDDKSVKKNRIRKEGKNRKRIDKLKIN